MTKNQCQTPVWNPLMPIKSNQANWNRQSTKLAAKEQFTKNTADHVAGTASARWRDVDLLGEVGVFRKGVALLIDAAYQEVEEVLVVLDLDVAKVRIKIELGVKVVAGLEVCRDLKEVTQSWSDPDRRVKVDLEVDRGRVEAGQSLGKSESLLWFLFS